MRTMTINLGKEQTTQVLLFTLLGYKIPRNGEASATE